MRLNTPQKLTVIFLIMLLVYWTGLQVSGVKTSPYNYLYSFLFGLPPLIGGLITIFTAPHWGGFKTNAGKGIFYTGLGLFLWGGGSMVWVFYYNFTLGVPVPYPSLADLGYAPGSFLYALGVFYLAKLSETRLHLVSKRGKLFVAVAPLVVGALSYYLFVTIARDGVLIIDGKAPIKIFLDIVYPLGDFIALTIVVLISGLSFPYMHGKYKFDIAATLAGISLMFIADVVFSYTTTVGTFYNGNFGDLLFTLSTSLLTFGILGFYTLKE